MVSRPVPELWQPYPWTTGEDALAFLERRRQLRRYEMLSWRVLWLVNSFAWLALGMLVGAVGR